ncbi:MAG: hypothetical protein U0R44_06815 [Candidatus Micrarchaeia archaeon]
MLSDMKKAVSLVFRDQRGLQTALAFGAAAFLFSISVPVLTIPGNSYAFFFSSTPPLQLVMTLLISAFMSLVMTMQVYAWRHKAHSIIHAGAGIAGLISGSSSIIFTSATCASCMSAVVSFIGFGSAVFLVEHQALIMAATFVILGVSFYMTSEKIAGGCVSCDLPRAKGDSPGTG